MVLGGTVVLHCPANGIPEPAIRWSQFGEPFSFNNLPNVRVQDGGRQLQVFNAHVIDMGHYSCTASNVAGNVTKQFLLDVLGNIIVLGLGDTSNNVHCHAWPTPVPISTFSI